MDERDLGCADVRGEGSVYVFWGDGKGKTTAALGMALRALGHGWRVHMVQFMKSAREEAGELKALGSSERFSAETYGETEWLRDEPSERHAAAVTGAMKAAERAVKRTDVDLLVLDEILYAVEFGLVGVPDVVRLLCERSPGMDVVLTGGWGEIAEITALADLVTEMKRHKHPFDHGADARQGIEY